MYIKQRCRSVQCLAWPPPTQSSILQVHRLPTDMARFVADTYVFLIILASFLALNSANDWPLTRCSRNDPNTNNCMLKAAQNSLSKVMSGIPLLRLPPLEPMQLGDKAMTTGTGPITLEVDFKNAVLSGVSKVRLDSAKYNKKEHRLDLEAFHKDIKLSAQYVMKGKIFFFPINNKGTTEISFRSVHCLHSFVFNPRSEVGLDMNPKQKTSVTATPNMRSLDVMHMNMTAQGLGSYGTRKLNDVMNNNWRHLYTSFKPSIETWLEDVYTKAMDPFFQQFNFDEMFPENLKIN